MVDEETASEPLLGHHREKKDPTLLLESSDSRDKGDGLDPKLRTYWWRWVVLAVFSLNLVMTNLQWVTFSPIADVVACYYGISNFWVNSLSMGAMLVYILCFVLSALSLERLGLQTTLIIASCMNALGAALRLAGTGIHCTIPCFRLPTPTTPPPPPLFLPSGRHYFWVLLSGQTVGALTNALVWGAPSLLSSVWFPPSERATATAFAGAISPQVILQIGIIENGHVYIPKF